MYNSTKKIRESSKKYVMVTVFSDFFSSLKKVIFVYLSRSTYLSVSVYLTLYLSLLQLSLSICIPLFPFYVTHSPSLCFCVSLSPYNFHFYHIRSSKGKSLKKAAILGAGVYGGYQLGKVAGRQAIHTSYCIFNNISWMRLNLSLSFVGQLSCRLNFML